MKTISAKNLFLAICIYPLFIFVDIITYSIKNNWYGIIDTNTNSDICFVKLGVLSVLTLIGILFGNMYQHLEKNVPRGDSVSLVEFKEILASRSLWRSLVASPIVCGVVITTVSNDQNTLLSLVFAFENGFFWNNVLSKRMKNI